MAERVGSSFFKNGALGFAAAAAVATASPTFADPPGFPSAQAGMPRVMGVRYVHFFSGGEHESVSGGNHESGFIVGKGITGGARVTDVFAAARDLSLGNLAPAILAATGRAPTKSSSYMQLDITPQSLRAWGDERGNGSQHSAFYAPSLAKMPLPDTLTVMDKYPKELCLNSAADATPARPRSHLKLVPEVNAANVRVLDNLSGLALH